MLTREQEMRHLFEEEGLSLAEIGKRYGLTRERVRQLMQSAGVDTTAVIRKWGELRRAEAQRRADEEREAADRQRRAQLLKPVATAKGTKTYTSKELLEALRAASKDMGGGQPSSMRWRSDGRTPSVGLYVLRFGSWQRACELAGVATRKVPARRSAWSDDDVAACVGEFLKDADNAKGGGPKAYDAWRDGKGYPSSATARQRFGSWGAARNRALELVGN